MTAKIRPPGRRWLLIGAVLLGTGGCQIPVRHAPSEPAAAPVPSALDRSAPAKELTGIKAGELAFALALEEEKADNLASAILQLEKARGHDPGHREIPLRLARLYARAGNDRKALAEYAKALELAPKDADLLNDLGYYHYGQGRWKEAEASLRKATALKPRNLRAWNNLGMALGQQGMYQECLEAFRHAGTPAQAECNLAFIYLAQGELAKAKQAYRQALAEDPNLTLAAATLSKLEAGEYFPPTRQSSRGGRPGRTRSNRSVGSP